MSAVPANHPDDNSLADRFLVLFAGLDRAHGRYEVPHYAKSDADGKVKGRAWTVHAPLTNADFLSHLSGSHGIGVCPIREDATCVFGAGDVDVYPLDLTALAANVKAMGLPLLVCRSKSGGAHLYLFLSEAANASLVRAKLKAWAAALGHPGVEVFPKQEKFESENDDGNWINLPYFGGARSTRYALAPDGSAMTPLEFLTAAEAMKITPGQLSDWLLKLPSDAGDLLDGAPPCLPALASQRGFDGWENNTLFNLAVYLKKRYPDVWQEKLDEYNIRFLTTPLPAKEVKTIVKSVGKKDYFYKCKDQPIVAVCDKAACRGCKFGIGARPPARDTNLPVIRIVPGELPRVVDEAEKALRSANSELYRQGNRIVRVIWDRIKTAGGGEADAMRLSTVNADHLREKLEGAARFEKFDGRSGDYAVTGCPKDLPDIYLARDGTWALPPLLGVVTAPTLRADGTLLDKPGYDEASALIFDPLGVEFQPIPQEPTRSDAEDALNTLRGLISTFPFSGDDDRAVALSGIITTLIRRALPTAPMHAFNAHVAGAGKSMLVDLSSIIATGNRAAVTSTGRDKYGEAELEKRLVSSMLAGDAVLSIDNVDGALGGEFLCQLLTQTRVKLRRLGGSVNVEVPVTTSFFATGNNLVVVGDLTRRVLMATVDAKCPRPELREFSNDPLEDARVERGKFVAAALTLVRAFHCAGSPRQESPLGGYREWSRMVRDPLIWLGENDPVGVMEKVRAGDPRLAALTDVIAQWMARFGIDKSVQVRDMIAMALKALPRKDAGDEDAEFYMHPDLRAALRRVAPGKGHEEISHEGLGWWLKKNAGRTVAVGEENYRFVLAQDEAGGGGQRWRLEKIAG